MFKVGQKVVCVCVTIHYGKKYGPDVNDIVCISGLVEGVTTPSGLPKIGILLKEYPIIPTEGYGFTPKAYNSDFFRPIVEIGDEVEEYILEKVRETETISV